MKERPIMFSGEMVKAILERRKAMTRRVMKLQPEHAEIVAGGKRLRIIRGGFNIERPLQSPYGVAGDRLWVRETWRVFGGREYEYQHHQPSVVYRADLDTRVDEGRWRPSIFMGRWASRLTLEITRVNVERLQDITPADVDAEGIELNHYYCDEDGGAFGHRCEPVERFKEKWELINGKRAPWDSNPWVWVISFNRVNS